jgi:hypothetical protein
LGLLDTRGHGWKMGEDALAVAKSITTEAQRQKASAKIAKGYFAD